MTSQNLASSPPGSSTGKLVGIELLIGEANSEIAALGGIAQGPAFENWNRRFER